jgi:hypothetical protein
VRFAYADPPYLGQGKRYAHLHPDALIWDDPATHTALVERLEAEYPDGWAVSLVPTPDALRAYVGPDRRLAAWIRPGSSHGIPQARVNLCVEVVLYRTAVSNSKAHGPVVNDYLIRSGPNQWQGNHTGTKPPEFCRWVLDLLGYNPATDQLDDLFPGEGNMTQAAAQHRLTLWQPTERKRPLGGSRRKAVPGRSQEPLAVHIDGSAS